MFDVLNNIIHIDYISIALIILLFYSLYNVIFGIIKRILMNDKIKKNSKEYKRTVTIVKLVKSIIRYTVIIIAIMTILTQLGVKVQTLIAGLGIASLIAGLAFQDVLKDLLSGIFIIADNEFFVGEIIQVGLSFKGEVIEIGLRNTRLKNANGDIKIIANRNITDLINFSVSDSLALIDLCVPYSINEADLEEMIKTNLADKIKKIPDAKSSKMIFQGIQQLEEDHYVYRIGIPCKPNKNINVQRATLAIIKDYFIKNNKIKITTKELI